MASEDNFLKLDPSNFDDEIMYHIFNGDINDEDLQDFLNDGFISQTQYDMYLDYLNYMLLNQRN